jgi:hypothetical protein
MEKDIEAYLVAVVQARGGKAWKFTSPAHRGVSDRIVLLPGGVVWFVEVKTETGRLSALQIVFQRAVIALGGNYVCVYGREGVDEWLRRL